MCPSGPRAPEPQVWCFQCGARYAAEVAACVECGVATVNRPPADATDVGEADEEQLEYDFHGHSSQSRSMMESLLLGAGLPHAWQGAVLIIRADDEEQVDEFVEATNRAAAPVLAPDTERVAYEMAGLDDDYIARLRDALDAAGIAYAFDDEGDLEVAVADEARVDGLFDKLAEGDTVSEFGTGLDGVDAHDVLSRLFVAADRLQRNPRDRKGTRNLDRGSQEIRELALPFGFEARTWRAVLEQVDVLVDCHDSDATADEIAAVAATTRDILHTLV